MTGGLLTADLPYVILNSINEGDSMRSLHIRETLGALAALLIILPASLAAQTPQVISYQGVLTDASGQLRPDGDYQLSLWLYDAVTGGNVVWRDEGLDTSIAFNISALSLQHLDFPDLVERMCRALGVPTDRLVL